MQKILHFEVDDITVDPDQVADRLHHACSRSSQRYRVRGVCQLDLQVSFILRPLESHESLETYQFGWLEDATAEGFEAAVTNRWSSGYDTLSAINLGESRYMLLLARQAEV